MANNSSSDWDITAPANADPISDGAKEIRLARAAVAVRQDKEHVAAATAGAGGEHKPGSAKVYVGTANPTLRPDGTTALGALDVGRIQIRTDQAGILYYWTGSAWATIIAGNVGAGAITATQLAAACVTAAAIANDAIDNVSKIKDNTFTADAIGGPYTSLSKFVNFFWPADDVARNKFGPGFLGNTTIGRALMADGYLQASHLTNVGFPKLRVVTFTGAAPAVDVICGFDPTFAFFIPSGGAKIGFATSKTGDTTIYWSDGTKTANAVAWTGDGNKFQMMANGGISNPVAVGVWVLAGKEGYTA